MQTLQVDQNNNLVLYQGSLQVIDGVNALAQDVKTQVGLCTRENPFNLEEGIDYDNEICGKLGGVDYIKDVVRDRILTTNDEVVNVDYVEVEHQDGVLSIDARVSSIYGDVEI